MARIEKPSDDNEVHQLEQGLAALEDHANGLEDTRLLRNVRFGWQTLQVTPDIGQPGMPTGGRDSIGRYMGYQIFRRPNPPMLN